MGKKTKTNTPQFRPGLRTPSVDDFVRSSKTELSKVLPGRSVGFDKKQVAGNSEIWMLSGKGVSHAEAKYSYNVVPFLTSETGLFWITVTFEFEYDKAIAYLMSVCIIVFEGGYTDQKKTPLVRAEWDCIKEVPPPPHAQPHWHVYPGKINNNQPSFIEEEALEEFVPIGAGQKFTTPASTESGVSTWTRGEKFHFAMAARWHNEGQNAHQANLQHEWVTNWIGGCIKYILIQMKSLYGESLGK